MEKPLILISPQQMPMEEPFKENYTYSNCYNSSAIINAGGLPLIPPFLEDGDAALLMEKADGLLLSGGEDISPGLYGEEKLPCCGSISELRDKSDYSLLRAALKLKKPVLCICRGAQLANVYFGGSLYQDLKSQSPGDICHSVFSSPGYTLENVHAVTAEEGTPLYELLGERRFMVNSLHHQGIKKLAPGLKAMAYADDGLVEGWYLPSEEQWIRACQWHPEMLKGSRRSRSIFLNFIKACRNKRA